MSPSDCCSGRMALGKPFRRALFLSVLFSLAWTLAPSLVRADTDGMMSAGVDSIDSVMSETEALSDDADNLDEAAQAPDGVDDAVSEELTLASTADDGLGAIVALAYERADTTPLIEFIDGHWNGSDDDFFVYDFNGIEVGDRLTVTYENGSKVYVGTIPEEGDWSDLYFESDDGDRIERDSLWYSDDQLGRHWTVGTNSYTVGMEGTDAVATVAVRMVANPVASLSYRPVYAHELIEGLGGEDYTDYDGHTFYRYRIDPTVGDALTINYNDGRGTVTYVYTITENWDQVFVNESDASDVLHWQGEVESGDQSIYGAESVFAISTQRYDHLWTVGDNVWRISYLNHTCDVGVKVFADKYPDAIAKGTSGSCVWVVDENGHVDLMPINGVSGSLDDHPGDLWRAWEGADEQIKSVTVQEGVAAGRSIVSIFGSLSNLREVDLRNLDTSRTTMMDRLFYGSDLESLDLSTLDTTHATSMDEMFDEYDETLTTVKLGENFSFSGAGSTRLCSLPSGAWAAESDGALYQETDVPSNKADTYTRGGWEETGSCWSKLDDDGKLTIRPKDGVSGEIGSMRFWDNADVKEVEFVGTIKAPRDSSQLFRGAEKLTSINLEALDTSLVTDMSSMFEGCSSLEEVDLSTFDLTEVTRANYMFRDCSSLKTVNAHGLNAPLLKSTSGMFEGCKMLTAADFGDFSAPALTDCSFMFLGCCELNTANFVGASAPAATNLKQMFDGCAKLETATIGGLVGENVKNLNFLFDGCTSLTSVDTTDWDMSNGPSTAYLFCGCKALASLDVADWDMSNKTSLAGMFSGCSSLEQIDVSKWDVSNVVSTNSMFSSCSSLKTVDVSAWQVGSLKDTAAMFAGCSALETADFSKWRTAPMTGILSMFEDCHAIRELDLSGFDTSQVESVSCVFRRCYALESLDITGWDTTSVQSNINGASGWTGMFSENKALKEISVGDKYVIGHSFDCFPTPYGATKKWWSEKDQEWLTWYDIFQTRSLTADTYYSTVDPIYNISEGELEAISNLAYTGYAQTPKPKVLIDGQEVDPPESLLYSYTDNKETGIATLTVTGCNFCTGELTTTFKIVPADLSAASIALSTETYTYNGYERRPKPTVRVGDMVLAATEYSYRFEDNVNAGTGRVVIAPINENCTGEGIATFTIKPAELSGVTLTLSKTAFTYNGKVQRPGVTVSGADGCQAGVDYDIVWSNKASKVAGKYKVSIVGKGNYTGTPAAATYTIKKATNPMKTKAAKANVTVKLTAVTKKAQVLASNVKFVKKSATGVTYTNVSAGKIKKWQVNKTTGKLTVPKNTKKGTYTVKIKVTAKANANYVTPKAQTVTYKVVVK